MKVSFSPVRVQPIHQNYSINNKQTNSVQQSYMKSERLGPVVRISFKGNPGKVAHQFASFSAEDKGLGLSTYNLGGEAVVVQEAASSLDKRAKADFRIVLPYHVPDNKDGLVAVIKRDDLNDNRQVDVQKIVRKKLSEIDNNDVIIVHDKPSKGLAKYVPLERTNVSGSINKLNSDNFEVEKVEYQLFKVLDSDKKTGVTRYLIYTPETARMPKAYATVNSVRANAYSAAADDLYALTARIFARMLPQLNNSENGNFNPGNIMLHDRQAYPALIEMAELSANGNAYYTGMKSHSIMHNPGRAYQGVDDDALAFLRRVATDDVMNDLKKHPDYQELVSIDALRQKKNPTADDIKQARAYLKKYISNSSIVDELDYSSMVRIAVARANTILKKYLSPFIDDLGSLNMTKIAIAAVKANPANNSIGTVSLNYEYEMLKYEDISKGLTKSLKELKDDPVLSKSFISVTNGSTPANMRLDDPNANFGRGGNGLSSNEVKNGLSAEEAKNGLSADNARIKYNPFVYENGVPNVEKIITAKKNNTEWLLNSIANAAQETTVAGQPTGLQKLFFNAEQIKEGSTILGELSGYEAGDKLIIGWGRPDAQKGMPATVEAFLKFLQDSTVDANVRKKTKLLVGAGVWQTDHRDWLKIKKLIEKELPKIDGGAYTKNVMYVNGFFPNRLAACATYSIFTSVFEPCGITPLESYAAGTPVISNKTGGAPNFIVDGKTGFLTKTPYLVNPEDVGKKATDSFEEIDDARRAAITDQVKDCIKRAVNQEEGEYNKMVAASIKQHVDWHENADYNNGKAALNVYLEDIYKTKFENVPQEPEPPVVTGDNSSSAKAASSQKIVSESGTASNKQITGFAGDRNEKTLKKILPNGQQVVEATKEKIVNSSVKAVKSFSWGKTLLAIAGLGAAGLAAVAYVKKQKQDKGNNINVLSSTPTINSNNQSLTSLINSQPIYSANIPKSFNKTA